MTLSSLGAQGLKKHYCTAMEKLMLLKYNKKAWDFKSLGTLGDAHGNNLYCNTPTGRGFGSGKHSGLPGT